METVTCTPIFLDVFRRADKNDDGAVDWGEFLHFFSDGVMGKEELLSLFNKIDSHNTNNIDTGELCEYFAAHLGRFKDVFDKVDELNLALSNALMATSQAYPIQNRRDKFVTRFLLRELLNQITAALHPLESASDILDEQAREESDIIPVEYPAEFNHCCGTASNNSGIIPGRVVRRARRQYSTQSSLTDPSSMNLTHMAVQVDRLTALIDRFENVVNFDGITDEEFNVEFDDLVVLVQRGHHVKPDQEDRFRDSLRIYQHVAKKSHGCLHISVRSYRDSGRLLLYEVWNSDKHYTRHLESDALKKFKQDNETYLEDAPEENTLCIPAHWWKKEH